MIELIKPHEKNMLNRYPDRVFELVTELSEEQNDCTIEKIQQLVDISYRCGYIDGEYMMYHMGDDIL